MAYTTTSEEEKGLLAQLNQQHDPKPYEVLSFREQHTDYYPISFAPDVAGVVPLSPRLVRKTWLAAKHPAIVTNFLQNQRAEKAEAEEIQKKCTVFAAHFCSRKPSTIGLEENIMQQGVKCDQELLPGMFVHWGEVRVCETHINKLGENGEPSQFKVCKGCRTTHYALTSTSPSPTIDRQYILVRGARVNVCRSCATQAIQKLGRNHRSCVCDTEWSCFQCREKELEKLDKAMEGYDGRFCVACCREEILMRDVEVCLSCEKVRTHGEMVRERAV